MWLPVITGGRDGYVPGRVATTLPISSTARSSPRSRIHVTTRSRPSRSASVRARRALPRVPSGPSMAPSSASASRRPRRRPPSIRTSAGSSVTAGRGARTPPPRPAPSARPCTAASNSSLPRSAVAAVGSPISPSGPKSSESQPKLTRPPNRTCWLPASHSGTLRTAAAMSTRSGRRWSMSEVSSVPPWTPMPSSPAGAVPPWSTGKPGWARNVIRPYFSRSSRHATFSSAELPPWPLTNTSFRAGRRLTLRPMSSTTDSSVVADSQIVPADQACSFDFV